MTVESPPFLRGERVCLRRQRDADVPALFALHADAVAMRFWSYPPFERVEQAQALLERNLRDGGAAFLPWAIARAADDALVGTCTLFGIDAAHRRAMLGYILAREHWGRGLATAALRLALTHAFGAMGLHRVEADIDPRNVASLRLVERLGFVKEGLQRERYFVGEDVQDSALYGLLAREFEPA